APCCACPSSDYATGISSGPHRVSGAGRRQVSVERRLRALVVSLAGPDVANAAVLLEPAVELHLPLAIRLAVHAQSRKGKRLQPCLGNLALAALADAIASIVHATERLIDGLHPLAIPIAQDEIDLLVPSVAGEVVGVHALVFARVADLVQVLLNAAEELRTHLFERVPGFLEKRLAHFPNPLRRGGGNLEPGSTQVNGGLG